MSEAVEDFSKIYRFDEFQIDPRKRLLLRAGEALTLHSKTFDLLLALVTSGGQELSKDLLMQRVWRDQIVEENNLAVHIYNLRKLLGERKDEHRYIITIPGRGYRFVADVDESQNDEDEVIVESRTISRVVIEEETPLLGGEPESKLLTGSAMGAYTGPTYLDKVQTSTLMVPQSRSVNRGAQLFIVGLVVLLTALGVSAYWVLRNRSRVPKVTAPPAGSRMTITRLTDGKQVGAPAISPDGKFIAYGENAVSGSGGLFVLQLDTNRVVQLLESGDRTFGAVNFSPDGSLIYYIVFDKKDFYGAIYSVSLLGGTPKRIVSQVGPYFSLSPDGKRVAFYRNEQEYKRRTVMLAAVDGSSEQTLFTRTPHELELGGPLVWSPDGTFVVLSADSEPNDLKPNYQLVALDVNNGSTRVLAGDKFVQIGKMCWTNDHRSLVFVARLPNKENQLYLMDYPSGVVRSITNDLETYGNYGLGITADSSTMIADIYETTAELWSVPANGDASKMVRVKSGATSGLFGLVTLPNGRIAYVARSGNNRDIWTVAEDGTDARPITTDPPQQVDLTASPDGRYLLYAAGQSGEQHIYRMNSEDGSGVTQLTFGASFDSQPDVSPDGQWVVYTASDGKERTIKRVPIAGGPVVQLTDYESRTPHYSPDGKFIACILPSDTRAKLASIAVIPVEGGKPINSFELMSYGYGQYPYRWAPDGKSLIFRRATNGISDLWQQSLSGGEPKQLTNFQSGAIWRFDYSRDGKRIVLSRGSTFVDAVLIKNFR
jgi:Tol biopolymer transport system component/DNA-binding winged helix-turn-helix (wHTH) protein